THAGRLRCRSGVARVRYCAASGGSLQHALSCRSWPCTRQPAVQLSQRKLNAARLSRCSARLPFHSSQQPQRQRSGVACHSPTQLRDRDGHPPMKILKPRIEILSALALSVFPLTACKHAPPAAAEKQPTNVG